MFGSGDSTTAGPTEHPGGEPASASQDRQRQMPMPLSGGRKPTPTIRSHCQHAGLERHCHCHRGRYQWSWWSLGDRDKLDDEDAGKQFVSVPPFHPRPSSYFPFFPSPSFFGYRVWSRAAKGGLSPTPFSSSPDTGCPLACRFHDDNRRSSDLPAVCTSSSCVTRPGKHASISTYFSSSFSRTCPSKHFFGFNTIYILIE